MAERRPEQKRTAVARRVSVNGRVVRAATTDPSEFARHLVRDRKRGGGRTLADRERWQASKERALRRPSR